MFDLFQIRPFTCYVLLSITSVRDTSYFKVALFVQMTNSWQKNELKKSKDTILLSSFVCIMAFKCFFAKYEQEYCNFAKAHDLKPFSRRKILLCYWKNIKNISQTAPTIVKKFELIYVVLQTLMFLDHIRANKTAKLFRCHCDKHTKWSVIIFENLIVKLNFGGKILFH